MRLFDTHAHLDDEKFDTCREEVVARAMAAGVERVVCVGVSRDSSCRCVELAGQFPLLVAAVGIQPNYVAETRPGDWDEIVRLAEAPRVVALGETGLDRYWDHSPFALQQDYFDRHLRLSQQTGLPFIVHMRDCDEDVLAMLQEAARRSPLRGIMHSFTGRLETMRACLELGLHISFAGMVTYKKSEELRQIARSVPLDRLLIETDSPYLSPHPKRAQRPNEPALLVHTAACLGELFGVSGEELAEQTTQNACELLLRDRGGGPNSQRLP